MKKIDIILLSSYFICTGISVAYFYKEAISYENINSTVEFVFFPITFLFFLMLSLLSLHVKDNLKNTSRVTLLFFFVLVGTFGTFQLTKPNVTYAEALKIIEEKFNVSIDTDRPTTILSLKEYKQIYRFTTDHSEVLTYDPYTHAVEKLK